MLCSIVTLNSEIHLYQWTLMDNLQSIDSSLYTLKTYTPKKKDHLALGCGKGFHFLLSFIHPHRNRLRGHFLVVGPLKRGGGVKPPEPLKKITRTWNTRRINKKKWMLCSLHGIIRIILFLGSLLVNIDQQKKVIQSIRKYYFSNLNLTEILLSIYVHFQGIKQNCKTKVVLNHFFYLCLPLRKP